MTSTAPSFSKLQQQEDAANQLEHAANQARMKQLELQTIDQLNVLTWNLEDFGHLYGSIALSQRTITRAMQVTRDNEKIANDIKKIKLIEQFMSVQNYHVLVFEEIGQENSHFVSQDVINAFKKMLNDQHYTIYSNNGDSYHNVWIVVNKLIEFKVKRRVTADDFDTFCNARQNTRIRFPNRYSGIIFDINNVKQAILIGVHLKSGHEDTDLKERETEVNCVNKVIAEWKQARRPISTRGPVIVIGDMNTNSRVRFNAGAKKKQLSGKEINKDWIYTEPSMTQTFFAKCDYNIPYYLINGHHPICASYGIPQDVVSGSPAASASSAASRSSVVPGSSVPATGSSDVPPSSIVPGSVVPGSSVPATGSGTGSSAAQNQIYGDYYGLMDGYVYDADGLQLQQYAYQDVKSQLVLIEISIFALFVVLCAVIAVAIHFCGFLTGFALAKVTDTMDKENEFV